MNRQTVDELVRRARQSWAAERDEVIEDAGQRLLDEIEKAQFIARLASDENDTSRLIMLTGILSDYCNRVAAAEEVLRCELDLD